MERPRAVAWALLVGALAAGSTQAAGSADLRSLVQLGRRQYRARRYLAAARTWRRVARARPRVGALRELVGRALYRSGRREAAELWWREALRLDPSLEVARKGLRLLGVTLGAGGAGEGSVGPTPVVTAVARVDPRSARTDPDDVLRDIELVDLDDAVAMASWLEGKRLLRAGDPRAAVLAFQLAWGHGFDSPDLDLQLGIALAQDERVDAAAAHLRRAAGLDPSDAEVFLWQGKVEALRGDAEAEVEAYQRALSLEPDHGEAHFRLALVYDRVGNFGAVARHAQRAIRADERWKSALQGRVKGSAFAAAMAAVGREALQRARDGDLSDEGVDDLVDRVVGMLGEDLLDEDRDVVRRVVGDFQAGRRRAALRGLQALSPEQRARVLVVVKQQPEAKEWLKGR